MRTSTRWAALAAVLAVVASTFTATTAAAQVPQPYCGTVALWGVEQSGRLSLYLHLGAEKGDHKWERRRFVGTGWNGTVLAGNGDVLYFVPEGTGELRRYRWDGEEWETFDGAEYEVIGHGFDRYVGEGRTLAVVGESFIGIDDTGDLRIYKRMNDEWTNAAGEVIGTGWDVFDRVVPSNGEDYYAFDSDGNAYLYRYNSYLKQWEIQAKHIDTGWGDFTNVVSAGSGVLYATTTDGLLLWYHYHYGWAYDGIPRHVGEGWNGVTAVVSANICSPHPG
ncbi:hypothetical protein JOD54_004431 [Actinokineospora baliensis]|uniref:tachylectin-related carbohydrate-binding protein n=1 Tax=Actinokineospora baliensis TaxID=547056 RepID=UPI0019578F8B|nr:tachylectin-related carbohydrate-binding protein [Actinokineospora baliensis]MBM7774227.1 hypothetical protein [Actinokineospora baliensis]